jgi:hypothetical protein
LRDGQSVDAVIFCVGADELDEDDLPTKLERRHQTIVSSRNFEPDALAVQHLGLRSGSCTSSVDVQFAALTTLYQRSRATFAPGEKSTSVLRAMTLTT